jgi:hypothetical protein
MDVLDEVSGVQSVVVTTPDGKKRREIKRLPRTPQEQALYEQGEQLMGRAIQNIQDLYQYDPNSVISFAPIIDTFAEVNEERARGLAQIANLGNIQADIQAFREMRRSIDDDMFARQNRQMEENLAHRGWSRSTAGQEARAFAAYNENLYRKESENDALKYGEALAEQRLNRNTKAFALDETGRQARLGAAQNEYALRREQRDELERKRQTAIGENMNLLRVGSGITGQDLSKALGSKAPEIANQTFQMQSTDALNRYTAGVNAQNAAYDRARYAYDNRPPSFMDMALDVGGTVGGAILTAAPNTLAGRIGQRIY